MRRALTLIGWAAVVGLAAGVFLDVATFLVARYGPQADSWSFRGNGALAVPFGLGPAILAGAWAALVLRYRGFARWKELGLAAALVGVLFLLVSVLVLALFNSAAMGVSSDLTFLILGWMVLAPVLAAFVRAPAPQPQPSELPAHVGAAAILGVVLILTFFLAGLVLAPGS
ncbi:MAG TPA: hypothetical protein VLR46_07975 [Candidatus Dormibacteraeota bacterium]|nr:hypothetical protein [Candidatus Dormibacteraeota bacterium]